MNPMDERNRNLLATPISTFRCPSEVGPLEERFRDVESFNPVTVPLGNYGLNLAGCVYSFSEVRDGLSNSLMLGEKVVASARLYYPPDDTILHTASTWCCLAVGFKRIKDLYFVGPLVAFDTGVAVDPPEDALLWRASSYHPGGGQVVLYDGSVKFLHSSIDSKTLSAHLPMSPTGRQCRCRGIEEEQLEGGI
jgi:hypothetical protein